jgi:hypothetical protein
MSTTTAIFYVSLFLIGLGIFMIFFIGYTYFSSRNMEEWRVVRGKIIKSDIMRVGKPLNPFKLLVPQIQYQYFVLGMEYIGANITIMGKATYNLRTAQEWIAPYPVGKMVNVLYNPDKHGMSVLEKGFSITSSYMAFPVFGALGLILLGIFILFQNM